MAIYKTLVPHKTIYTYAKYQFNFSRRMTNTYLCSASVYESIVQDPTLPTPMSISHIRSLHKYEPEVRRLIWKDANETATRLRQTLTEDLVSATMIRYGMMPFCNNFSKIRNLTWIQNFKETGIGFSDLTNEYYSPPGLINIAKRVIGDRPFDLDPASSSLANQIHPNGLASKFYDEFMDGRQQPWSGDVWLSPPHGFDSKGMSQQSLWFDLAEKKFLQGEIRSCQVLLKLDYGSLWLIKALGYPHCILRERLQFSTPTGKEKANSEDTFVLIYL
jgi:hypothetical protein